jgi:hypothetical protein
MSVQSSTSSVSRYEAAQSLTQGLLHSTTYNIDISDCIIPTIELQPHTGEWTAPEGANAKVELFLYRQQVSSQELFLYRQQVSSQELFLYRQQVSSQELFLYRQLVSSQELFLYRQQVSSQELFLYRQQVSSHQVQELIRIYALIDFALYGCRFLHYIWIPYLPTAGSSENAAATTIR